MKPKSILDPSFKYVPSTSTDIRATFERIRREQRQQSKPAQQPRTLSFVSRTSTRRPMSW